MSGLSGFSKSYVFDNLSATTTATAANVGEAIVAAAIIAAAAAIAA